MKSSPKTLQARPGLPGPAAPANSSHDHPNVMPPPKPLRRILTGLAAALTLGLFALPGVSRADSIANWYINGNLTETWTSTSGGGNGLRTVTSDFQVGSITPGTLNQTGGTITMNCNAIIGQVTDGTYSMSGNASLIGAGRTLYVGNPYTASHITAIWSLTDTANASVGTVNFGNGNDSKGTLHLLLSGSATFNATSLSGLAGADEYISFATGSTATLTVAGQSYNYYKGLIEGGFIRVDGASATMSQFQVVGSTLSLATGGPPLLHLVITSVSPASPSAGTGFAVTVETQNDSNVTTAVTVATEVTLTLKTGTGTLGGIVSDTIAANSSSVTISGVTYTKAESGVKLEASGGSLAAGESAAFTVVPGAANQLAFTTQPGGGAPGEVWPTQPVVTVQDANGNTVDSDASIALAITTGTGPGTLSGTKTVSAVNGVATFSGLSIDLAGTGYQLTATSAGLAFADSSAFDIAVPGDSTIAGWHVTGTKTWTGTSWYDGTTFHDTGGNGMIGVTGQFTVGFGGGNPGTLNQTGGTITCLSTSDGTIMGQVASGTYNMSGYATYIDNVGPYTIFGNFTGGGDVATWSLSDHASVTIGSQGLSIGWPGGTAGSRHLLLSGAASFTTASLTFIATGGDANYISFATGSTATLTVTAVLPENAPAYYEALVTNGSIRVDGVAATMSQFQVTGNTLSLGGGAGTPYDIWANGTFSPPLTAKLPTDNQDEDSLNNLQEYAFGTQPTVTTGEIVYVSGGAVTTPGAPKIVAAGGTYSMVFGRRADYLTAGVTYAVQFSTALEAWVDNNDTTNPPVQVATNGTINAMSVPYPDTIETPSGPRKPTFSRVMVVLAP